MQIRNGLQENMSFLKFMEFSGIDEKVLEEKMQRETDSFRLNGTMLIEVNGTEEQMAYTLFFKKYDNPNTHLPDKFRVMLVDQPERQGLFVFDDRHPISAKNAFHLLHERGVMKPATDDVQLWYQMDFSKRDMNGDGLVRLYTIHRNEFDLEKQLERYPINELKDATERANLINRLYNGEPALATISNVGVEKIMQLEVYPKGPLLNGREVQPGKQQTSKKPDKQQKQGWEIPKEKRRNKRRGLSL